MLTIPNSRLFRQMLTCIVVASRFWILRMMDVSRQATWRADNEGTFLTSAPAR